MNPRVGLGEHTRRFAEVRRFVAIVAMSAVFTALLVAGLGRRMQEAS